MKESFANRSPILPPPNEPGSPEIRVPKLPSLAHTARCLLSSSEEWHFSLASSSV